MQRPHKVQFWRQFPPSQPQQDYFVQPQRYQPPPFPHTERYYVESAPKPTRGFRPAPVRQYATYSDGMYDGEPSYGYEDPQPRYAEPENVYLTGRAMLPHHVQRPFYAGQPRYEDSYQGDDSQTWSPDRRGPYQSEHGTSPEESSASQNQDAGNTPKQTGDAVEQTADSAKPVASLPRTAPQPSKVPQPSQHKAKPQDASPTAKAKALKASTSETLEPSAKPRTATPTKPDKKGSDIKTLEKPTSKKDLGIPSTSIKTKDSPQKNNSSKTDSSVDPKLTGGDSTKNDPRPLSVPYSKMYKSSLSLHDYGKPLSKPPPGPGPLQQIKSMICCCLVRQEQQPEHLAPNAPPPKKEQPKESQQTEKPPSAAPPSTKTPSNAPPSVAPPEQPTKKETKDKPKKEEKEVRDTQKKSQEEKNPKKAVIRLEIEKNKDKEMQKSKDMDMEDSFADIDDAEESSEMSSYASEDSQREDVEDDEDTDMESDHSELDDDSDQPIYDKNYIMSSF